MFPILPMDGSEAAAGAMAVFVSIFIFIVITVATLAIPVAMTLFVHFDAKKLPESAWQTSGQSKILWVILTFFFGVIPLIIYFLAIKPKVQEVAAAMSGAYGTIPGYGQAPYGQAACAQTVPTQPQYGQMAQPQYGQMAEPQYGQMAEPQNPYGPAQGDTPPAQYPYNPSNN